MPQQPDIVNAIRQAIQNLSPDELRQMFRPDAAGGIMMMMVEDPRTRQDLLIAKNIKIFGDANAYVDDFLNSPRGILTMIQQTPPGIGRDTLKANMRGMVEGILNVDGLDDAHRQLLTQARDGPLAAVGGRRRRRTTRRRGQKSRRHHK